MAERFRNWAPPAELATGPREVEMAAGGLALLVLVFVFAAGAVAGGVFLWRAGTERSAFLARLNAEGATTEGVILRLSRGEGKSSDRFVSYEFEHEGSVYRSRSRVPRRTWDRLHTGQRLNVRFLPADPARNRPADWAPNRLPPWLGFVLAGAALVPAALLALMLRNARLLLTEGRPAPALVLSHSGAKGGQRAVVYEFPVLNGSICSGKSDASNRPAPVGETICVIYDRENPKRNSPYPLQLFRVRGAPRQRARL